MSTIVTYRTANLQSCILYIYSTNMGTEYFKHGIYSPFISLQNAVCFINMFINMFHKHVHKHVLPPSCHSVAKQIGINIHKRNNTKNTVQTIQNTLNTSTHITKTPTHYKIHTYTHTYTLQNKLKQPHYKILLFAVYFLVKLTKKVSKGLFLAEHDLGSQFKTLT
jgi:hypothetical protein